MNRLTRTLLSVLCVLLILALPFVVSSPNLLGEAKWELLDEMEDTAGWLVTSAKAEEELTLTEELSGRKKTANNKIYVTPPVEFSDKQMEQALKGLRHCTPENVRELLREIVPNYHENPDAPSVE